MSHPRHAALALASTLVLLTGCTPTSPPTMSASPTVTTSTPTPSVDPLYVEAERVYREYFRELTALEVAGGAEQLPPVFKTLVMEPLFSSMQVAYRDAKEKGLHYKPGAIPILKWVRPLPGAAYGDSVIAVQTCVDGRLTVLLDGAGQSRGPGIAMKNMVFFKRDSDQVLKITVTDLEEVQECTA